MARIMPGARAEKMEELAVYCIISPFDKTVYINKTGAHRLRKAYTEHHCERVAKTAALFKKAKAEKNLPPIYLLESCQMPQRVAFRHCVAWTKYFLDHGYTQVTEDILTEYAQDLIPRTQALYDNIKDRPLEEVLTPIGGLFPNYNVRKGKSSSKPLVSINVSHEEYNIIKSAAKAEGLTLSAYCKKRCMNGRVINLDFSQCKEAIDTLDELKEAKRLLLNILFTIDKTGKYTPADIKNIQRGVDLLVAASKSVPKALNEYVKKKKEENCP